LKNHPGKNNTNILLNSQILEHLYIYNVFVLFCEFGGVDFFGGAMLFFHIPDKNTKENPPEKGVQALLFDVETASN